MTVLLVFVYAGGEAVSRQGREIDGCPSIDHILAPGIVDDWSISMIPGAPRYIDPFWIGEVQDVSMHSHPRRWITTRPSVATLRFR